jgi:hypothetical protein
MSVVCDAAGLTMAAEAAANPSATADLRFTFCIDLLLTLRPRGRKAAPFVK